MDEIKCVYDGKIDFSTIPSNCTSLRIKNCYNDVYLCDLMQIPNSNKIEYLHLQEYGIIYLDKLSRPKKDPQIFTNFPRCKFEDCIKFVNTRYVCRCCTNYFPIDYKKENIKIDKTNKDIYASYIKNQEILLKILNNFPNLKMITVSDENCKFQKLLIATIILFDKNIRIELICDDYIL